MIYPSSKSMRKVGSKYKLVLMAAQRSKQIKAGMKPLIETESTNPLTIAFEEIAAGEVIGETPDIDEIDTKVLEDIAKSEDTTAVLEEEAAEEALEAKEEGSLEQDAFGAPAEETEPLETDEDGETTFLDKVY